MGQKGKSCCLLTQNFILQGFSPLPNSERGEKSDKHLCQWKTMALLCADHGDRVYKCSHMQGCIMDP